MQMIYKKILVSLPHCPDCGEPLLGNGSFVMPYKCSCGVWKNHWMSPMEYEVTPLCACMTVSGLKDARFTKHTKYECSNEELGLLVAGTGPKE